MVFSAASSEGAADGRVEGASESGVVTLTRQGHKRLQLAFPADRLDSSQP